MAKKIPNKKKALKKNTVPPAKDSIGLIQTKAYQIWESRGRIHGEDLEIWLEAEKAVKS